jgi:hypothetical protein
MAQKQSAAQKSAAQKSAGKKSAGKKSGSPRTARPPAARAQAGSRKKVVRRPAGTAARKGGRNGASSASRPKGKKKSAAPALGRPKVTGDELLFLLFKEDYHARQIFDFLRVEKVRELEQYSPQQIVKLLSRPITETVERIRRRLAEKNRCLQDDAEYAAELKRNTP